MANIKIPIRSTLFPAYYQDFQCLTGACRDSCCADPWSLQFNKMDYLKIKRAPKPPETEEEISRGMSCLPNDAPDGMYARFRQDDAGKCAMLDENGLCILQRSCGEETLPAACSDFPRGKVSTPAGVELSLHPSCEGVLQLLWDLPDGVAFVESTLPKSGWDWITAPTHAVAMFPDIRSLCIDVLQCRALPLSGRLVLLGKLLRDLQGLDFDDEPALRAWLAQGDRLLAAPDALDHFREVPRDRHLFLSNTARLIGMLSANGRALTAGELMSAVCDGGTTELESHDFAFTPNRARYAALEERLDELLGHSEYFFENILVSLAFSLAFPALKSPESLWRSYVELCNLYACLRFAAVCACGKEVSRERLFHVLVQVSRCLLHSKKQQMEPRDELFRNDSATLAHMAILAGG